MNEKVATTATFITGGETITLCKSDIQKPSKTFNCNLEVLYEDDCIAAIHKPAGLLVSGNTFKTVTNALPSNLTKSNQVDVTQPQPAHRLDYPTTGVLLIGKTSASIIALNQLFKNKAVEKTYFAITIGEMKKEGSIENQIDDKPAISHYTVLKSVISERFRFLNLVMLSPKTGRRHQLRKHLLGIGNPILGDTMYNEPNLILKGKGLYLHAFSVLFAHPTTNETLTITSDLPENFIKIFSDFKIDKEV